MLEADEVSGSALPGGFCTFMSAYNHSGKKEEKKLKHAYATNCSNTCTLYRIQIISCNCKEQNMINLDNDMSSHALRKLKHYYYV